MVQSGYTWEEVVIKMFMGEYHHTIDDKGRLIIPSKVRYDLGDKFILTRGLDGCLFIYPKKDWNRIIGEYQNLPNTKDARNFMRFFMSGAQELELDKQGRINIYTPLLNYANISKECVIIGVNDHLEIWDKANWETFTIENEANFSDLADKLFSPNIEG